jgi:hypothetical protein
MTPILYMMFAALLMIIVTGCSSTGYSGGTSYHHRNSWNYDNHYRSGVNKNYNRSSGAARAGAAARSGGGGGGRAGGGGGGGGRR